MININLVEFDKRIFNLLRNIGTVNDDKIVVFPMVYIYTDEECRALYVGSTYNLRETHESLLEELWMNKVSLITIIPCQTMVDAEFYELALKLQWKPEYNKLNDLDEKEKFLNYRDVPTVQRLQTADTTITAFIAYMDDFYRFMFPNYVPVSQLPADIPAVYRVHDISPNYKGNLLRGKAEIDLRKAKLMKDVNSSIEKLHKLKIIPKGNYTGIFVDDNGKEIKYKVRNGIVELM